MGLRAGVRRTDRVDSSRFGQTYQRLLPFWHQNDESRTVEAYHGNDLITRSQLYQQAIILALIPFLKKDLYPFSA